MKYLNTPELLSNAKKKNDLKNSVLVMLAASIIFGVSVAITISRSTFLPLMVESLGSLALSAFLLMFAGGLFSGFLVKLTVFTLTGKGKFFDGLTVVAYSSLYLSFGFVAAAVFGYVPYLGLVLAFASVFVFGAVAYATLFRGVKDLFGTDMITALITVTVMFGVAFMALYAGILFGSGLTMESLLTGLMPTT